ncbi:MAG TPA: polysaccharide deacetylase family protein [Steroidobacteraceae bacterium]|nr:polysaccharide deacetylase family protein [Steroidobacteraceae bacterium]
MSPPIALKIDVDTLRGTLEGVPRLAALLSRTGAGATFYFSLGPDHTGRALKRVFRRGFLGKVRRTNVVGHYGIRTLLYGTLLPGPRIDRRAGEVMRAVRDAGFEVGVHCHDHVRWQDHVALAGAEWTAREFDRALESFAGVFGAAATTHAAAGWQINAHVLRLEQRAGLKYASDTRGSGPFWPSMDGVAGGCLQLPTTLPTFDELVGVDGCSEDGAAEEVLRRTRAAAAPQVFTLHAELEGQRLYPQFERLLLAWQGAGHPLLALRELHGQLRGRALPRHSVELACIPGRSGLLATQGPMLALAAEPA